MRNILIKGFIALSLAALASPAGAQTISSTKARPVAKKPQPINSEFSGGFRLNTDGWSLFADKGYVRSEEGKYRDMFHDIRLFQLELTEHKDPKETKRSITEQSGGGEQTRPFVYGKINNFYALKLGYGTRKMIAGKPEPGTISVHWVLVGGLALGMEKPYYLEGLVADPATGALTQSTFKYTEETRESFLTEQYISGSAGFTKGFGEMQFVPGLHAKTALHFDFAANRKTVMAVETGINAEYYSRGIIILANQDEKPLFVNLFASFQFGRRK